MNAHKFVVDISFHHRNNLFYWFINNSEWVEQDERPDNPDGERILSSCSVRYLFSNFGSLIVDSTSNRFYITMLSEFSGKQLAFKLFFEQFIIDSANIPCPVRLAYIDFYDNFYKQFDLFAVKEELSSEPEWHKILFQDSINKFAIQHNLSRRHLLQYHKARILTEI